MKMKRRTADMAGPTGKTRKIYNKDAAIDIKLFLEVAESICMRAGKLKIML